MRSLRPLLLVVLMAFMFVIPNFAQDSTDLTLADIVVTVATSETPEFTFLYAALSAANPAYLEALANPDYTFTVFAPTDAAFTEMIAALGMTTEEVLANTELLNTTLAYHVVPGSVSGDVLVAADGALLGTLVNGLTLTVAVTEEESVMVNYGTIIGGEIIAANGIIHPLDSVLIPDLTLLLPLAEVEAMPGSIAEIVATAASSTENTEFTILAAALAVADPSIVQVLTAGGSFTVFAPTDEAFTALLEGMELTAEDLLADTDLLNAVLAYHIVPGIFSAEGLVAAAGEAGSFNVVSLNGVLGVAVSEEGVFINDTATVTTANIVLNNGVVHMIDTVLLPYTEEAEEE